MDQTGAVLGPLLVAGSVARSHHFGPAFMWLALPAVGALVALRFARAVSPHRGTPPAAPKQQNTPSVSWVHVGAAGLLPLGLVDFPLLAYHSQQNSFTRPEVI